MITIPANIQQLVDTLVGVGVTPILVGGMPRDALLHRIRPAFVPKSPDWDIELFLPLDVDFDTQVVPALETHGPLRVDNVGDRFLVWNLFLDDGTKVDLSLPRTETQVGMSRQDFKITTLKGAFTPELFKQAAVRRDFTTGAIGLNLATGDTLDPFNGQRDLQNNQIRFVDRKTFVEDPLRVWRFLRFCGQLGLEPTLDLLILSRHVATEIMERISPERITQELTKLLSSTWCNLGMSLAGFVLEDTHEPVGITRATLAQAALEIKLQEAETFNTRLMILRQFSTERLWTHLKFNRVLAKRIDFADRVCNILDEDGTSLECSRRVAVLIGENMNKLSMPPEELLDFVRNIAHDMRTLRNKSNRLFNEVADMVSKGQHIVCIDGNELRDLGFKGASIGLVKNKVRELQIAGATKSEILTEIQK